MAYICYKEKGSCNDCEHYRYDVEEQQMCCWASFDLQFQLISKELKISVDKLANA